ncbi:adenosylcobalamin-dependent ribonucleoside-diphosphate reductase [Echinicola jeungdonensis]|uniref:Vitamin B12-dependent ribonucleotide reductase n=1 Tax=Echinicola jeungdonensis TaxID=709343 RepID=A0ABV5J969_9BACT|nr:adenosylcobalamin-dependent ribonucleoside-diphosphate reductase [Echinicola jeungdonensis]MDN3670525.1 adenosylcobalamin-dependent ribonucleoside-diphosphate reductase [Echinicola jeungdonensis]
MELNGVHASPVSDNALQILQERYLLKDLLDNCLESPGEMFMRVAKWVAKAEEKWGDLSLVKKWTMEFNNAMVSLKFLPNSPTLMNAGRKKGQLSACFVLPVEDSLPDIFSTLKLMAMIQQKGGGTGFNFSHLRPEKANLKNTGGWASGPIGFMKIFDAASGQIKQAGRRRGANMGILDIDHPDIELFISCKRNFTSLKNFNISVGVTDKFMLAVERKKDWFLTHPQSHEIVKTVNASDLWRNIAQNAWDCGDPGVVFLDTINRQNPLLSLGKIEATNPCGEVPLLPFEACNLGSINLSKFVSRKKVDWEALMKMVHLAIRFLDDIIEVNYYLQSEVKDISLANRKIGLGVMGWADMLVKLNIPYDSNEAVELASQIMKFIRDNSREASTNLAKERGCFPNWPKSNHFPHRPLRNATLNSIAPTGSISIIADTSSSIEPFFALAFQRKNVLNNHSLISINNQFLDFLYENQYPVTEILEKVLANGSTQDVKILPPEIRRIYKISEEISPEWHLKHQAAFQKYIDNAVSKTINLPESSTVEEVEKTFFHAWKLQTKGITIFRNVKGMKKVIEKGITVEHNGCRICVR